MSGTVTDRYDDLRKELADFCRTMDLCQNCVLHVPCECGRGTHFLRKWGNRNMSDEEVIEAYEIVFGGEKPRHRIWNPYLTQISVHCLEVHCNET